MSEALETNGVAPDYPRPFQLQQHALNAPPARETFLEEYHPAFWQERCWDGTLRLDPMLAEAEWSPASQQQPMGHDRPYTHTGGEQGQEEGREAGQVNEVTDTTTSTVSPAQHTISSTDAEAANPHAPTEAQQEPESQPNERPPAPGIQDYIAAVSTTMQETRGTPAPTPRPAKRQNSTVLRRSRRIADAGGPSHSLQKAQSVLMRKLGIIPDQQLLTQEAREAYARLFEHPLSPTHVAALAALFGFTLPEDNHECSAQPESRA